MGIGLAALFSLGTMTVLNNQNEATKALSSASALETVRAATNDWLRANYQQLVANLPVGGAPVAIPVARTTAGSPAPGNITVGAATIPSLQSGGFLAANMVDRNSYGQSHSVMVRQNAAGSLEALVVQTGGRAIADGDLGRIVQRVGVAGGARFATPADPAMAGMVLGNAGAWAADSAVWSASGVTPAVGRAAATVSFGNQSMLSDFLNRYDIGIPEANTMRTAVNMGNQDINAANNLRAVQSIIQNGGIACAGDATGCSFWLSNDGRFTDYNDGWIRFQGSYAGGGFSVQGAGANLYVEGQANVVGAVVSNDTLWAHNGLRAGRDNAGNPTGGGFLDVSGNAWMSGIVSIGQDPLTGAPTGVGALSVQGPGTFTGNLGTYADSYTGGNAYIGNNVGAGGSVTADGFWGNYVNAAQSLSSGGTLTVAGNSSVFGDLYVGGNISTPNGVFAGYVRSTGGMDAQGTVNAGGDINALNGRVRGAAGLVTGTARVPNSSCAWSGGEAGMIAMSTMDGNLLACTSSNTWRTTGGNSGLGPRSVQVLSFNSYESNTGTFYRAITRIRCTDGFQAYASIPPNNGSTPYDSYAGVEFNPSTECIGDATPGIGILGYYGPLGADWTYEFVYYVTGSSE